MTTVLPSFLAAVVGTAMVLVAYKVGYEKGIDAAMLAMEDLEGQGADGKAAAMQRHPSSKGFSVIRGGDSP